MNQCIYCGYVEDVLYIYAYESKDSSVLLLLAKGREEIEVAIRERGREPSGLGCRRGRHSCRRCCYWQIS